jgi:outer membrane protein assembly factor BamB
MMKRFVLIYVVLLASVLLSACGVRPSTSWPGLAADASQAYLTDGTFVYAIDLADGKQVWRFPEKAGKNSFYATPVLTPDGQVLVGSEGTEHNLYSLDSKTGREHWIKPFSGAKDRWIGAPLVVGGAIYAPNADGRLYILDMEGGLIDSVELGGPLWSQPATDGQLLYVTSLDHHLYAVDLASHGVVQTVDLGGAIPGGPTAGPEGVYVGSFSKKLELVANGEKRSLAEAENWIWGAPALDGETLYYADLNGNVYSLDLGTGRQNWGVVKPDGPIVASPLAVGDQIIIVTEAGSVVALDRNGSEVWPVRRELGGKIYSSPVVSNDLILVAPLGAEYYLYALDRDGRIVWNFKPE